MKTTIELIELSPKDAMLITGGDKFMHDVGYALGAYARWYIDTTIKGIQWLF